MIVGVSVHVVIERIGNESAVEPLPGTPVNGIVLVLDGLGDDFGGEVVVKRRGEMRLDRQAFVQELDKERLADLFDAAKITSA